MTKNREEPSVVILEKIFRELFLDSEHTILKSGAEEPIYFPAGHSGDFAEIHSTQDYFRSALHEVSHWCIAGEARRTLVDYGYWYEPDGRSVEQQLEFEVVEVKPQALEWIFTQACGLGFRLSVDNVNNPEAKPSEEFIARVVKQAKQYSEGSLPPRAKRFVEGLSQYFKQPAESFEFSCESLK